MTKPPHIIERVRDATRAAHAQLEERLDIFARLAVPARKTRLVARFYAFHVGAERAVSPVLAALPGLDYCGRRRTALLRDDLAAIGVEPRDIAVWAPPPASSVAEALGLLYVLEGSTLGGKIIRRRFWPAAERCPASASLTRTGSVQANIDMLSLQSSHGKSRAEDMTAAAGLLRGCHQRF